MAVSFGFLETSSCLFLNDNGSEQQRKERSRVNIDVNID